MMTSRVLLVHLLRFHNVGIHLLLQVRSQQLELLLVIVFHVLIPEFSNYLFIFHNNTYTYLESFKELRECEIGRDYLG